MTTRKPSRYMTATPELVPHDPIRAHCLMENCARAARAANDAHAHLSMAYASDNRTTATLCVMRARRAYLAANAATLKLWNSLQSWPRPDNAAAYYERATDYRDDARAATLAAIRDAQRNPKTR